MKFWLLACKNLKLKPSLRFEAIGYYLFLKAKYEKRKKMKMRLLFRKLPA